MIGVTLNMSIATEEYSKLSEKC